MKRKIHNIIRAVIAWLLSLLVLIPMILIVLNSFKSDVEADVMRLSFPKVMQWSNYAVVFEQGNMGRAFFLNSFIISVGSVTISVLASSLAAYVLVRNRDKMNKFIYTFIILGLVSPINIIPTMQIMGKLQIINTFQGIILLYSGILIPFSTFLFFGFIGSIPKSLDEAAVIDGCNGINVFGRIILPLLKPVLITVIVINFMNTWNDFRIPLYVLNDSKKWGLILSVYDFYGTYISRWNLVSAIILLAIVPILLLYLFGQRYIVSGVTAGAVKG